MDKRRSTEFWSPDGRFGVSLGRRHVERISRFCQEAGSRETGGVLIGRYVGDHSCARVAEVTGPPIDSRAGRTSFYRGVRGLQERLLVLWREARGFYLGEWHYHPGGSPTPSWTDRRQLQRIAGLRSYSCPEPILLIVGQDGGGAHVMRVFVFRRTESPVELSEPVEPCVDGKPPRDSIPKG